jgi:hypothetical protein
MTVDHRYDCCCRDCWSHEGGLCVVFAPEKTPAVTTPDRIHQCVHFSDRRRRTPTCATAAPADHAAPSQP